MATSRREFVYQSLAVTGAAMVAPGCARGRLSEAGPPPLQVSDRFEPGYVKV